MNEIILRLIIVKKQKVIEVSFDQRLSFYDNLKYLEEIVEIKKLRDMYVFDLNKNIFITKDITLKELNIENLMTFYLY